MADYSDFETLTSSSGKYELTKDFRSCGGSGDIKYYEYDGEGDDGNGKNYAEYKGSGRIVCEGYYGLGKTTKWVTYGESYQLT